MKVHSFELITNKITNLYQVRIDETSYNNVNNFMKVTEIEREMTIFLLRNEK